MKYNLLIEKLRLLNKKYVTRDELKGYFKTLKIDYNRGINNLITNKYLITIFRGIFYVPTFEEKKYNRIDTNFYEIINTTLKMKGINNWYFGLDSAIKLNNITHEIITIDYIINDKIFRPRPITIIGRKVKFIKLKKELFSFGINNNNIKYSDLEKTVLDSIYISKYNKEENKAILNKIIDLLEKCNKNKIKKYSSHYPKTVTKVIEGYLE